MFSPRLILPLVAVAVASTGLWLAFARDRSAGGKSFELLNVSYDVSRELWKDLNAAFAPAYEQQTGARVTIHQSHAGSSSQARSIVDGLDADVATLNLFTDTDLLRKKGLIPEDWQGRLPNNSLPFTSTIVFVVRKGNPLGIYDWPDLIRPGITAITPNPKTSGLGKLSFLAAWGSVLHAGGTEAEAKEYVATLFNRIPVLDTSGRAATTTFSQKGIGDVHLTFENEARLEVAEAKGELEIVHPSVSLVAEPYVTVVDANVDRHGTRTVADGYLRFLYTREGQEIIARHHLRPIDPAVMEHHAESFPPLKLLSITEIAAGWDEAQERFFTEGALFDQIYQPATATDSSK